MLADETCLKMKIINYMAVNRMVLLNSEVAYQRHKFKFYGRFITRQIFKTNLFQFDFDVLELCVFETLNTFCAASRQTLYALKIFIYLK